MVIPEVGFAYAAHDDDQAPPSDRCSRKPMWFDAQSPISARLLARLAADGTAQLHFVEALPRPDVQGIPTPLGPRAAEWLIEVLPEEA